MSYIVGFRRLLWTKPNMLLWLTTLTLVFMDLSWFPICLESPAPRSSPQSLIVTLTG